MKQLLAGVFGTLAAGALLLAAVIYGGFADVAADAPHGDLVFRLIETARERAIRRSSRDIAPPADLADLARVRRGAGNYEAMCADCHLTPAVEDSEIRKGLYPVPPDLARPKSAQTHADGAAARQFWIIKHGIKASAMPAWSRGGLTDADIWDLVAFLQRLPVLYPADYRELVEKSPGHSHGGTEQGNKPSAHSHAHGKPHSHKGHKH